MVPFHVGTVSSPVQGWFGSDVLPSRANARHHDRDQRDQLGSVVQRAAKLRLPTLFLSCKTCPGSTHSCAIDNCVIEWMSSPRLMDPRSRRRWALPVSSSQKYVSVSVNGNRFHKLTMESNAFMSSFKLLRLLKCHLSGKRKSAE